MTATKQQPIAGYRISDPSDPTIKPWLSDTPDDNGYTSEPLYAGAAPAAVAGPAIDRAATLAAIDDISEPSWTGYECPNTWADGLSAARAVVQSAPAAPALEAPAAGAPQGEYPHEQMDAMALARYKVAPSHASMLWSHAVVAGDGAQQLYVGREVECQNMARKFAGAFLDGAFAFHSMAAAPTAQAAPSLEAPAAPVDDRAEFEKWARQQSWIKDCQRYDDGRYGHYETEKAWATWQARAALAAAPQAPAAPSAVATQVIENLLQLARIVNTAVEDWGETKEDDSLEVIFHKEEADKLEEILEFFDSLPDAPESEGVILSGPSRAARVLRATAAPAAPALSAAPIPVMPRAITAGLGLDDSGEEPAYCVMVAFRQEDDARYALSILSAGLGATAAPAAGNWIAAEEVDRLVRDLDLALHGEADAAPQASLCDIVGLAKAAAGKLGRPVLAAPAAPAVDAEIIKKAARYDHLRDCNSGSLVVMQITGTGEDDWHVLTEGDADDAIDTAIAAQAAAKGASDA